MRAPQAGPVGILGGSGLTRWDGLEGAHEERIVTPWGVPSGPRIHGRVNGVPVVFLPRHGPEHTIAPHRINYRANVWAMHEAGVRRIIGVAAVGAIDVSLPTASLVVPHQLVDYTHSRPGTFYEEEGAPVVHIDFTHPYSHRLREVLLEAAGREGIAVHDGGVYGVTQGPRLETAAEVDRMERDGCTLVGMTAMPEAALARELELEYATLALVVNPAAGRGGGRIGMEAIERALETGMERVRRVLAAALPRLERIS